MAAPCQPSGRSGARGQGCGEGGRPPETRKGAGPHPTQRLRLQESGSCPEASSPAHRPPRGSWACPPAAPGVAARVWALEAERPPSAAASLGKDPLVGSISPPAPPSPGRVRLAAGEGTEARGAF